MFNAQYHLILPDHSFKEQMEILPEGWYNEHRYKHWVYFIMLVSDTKFLLKISGGKDYVFQKSNGDAEW